MLAALRAATAGLAVAVGLLLLLRIPLVATFRTTLVILAALEILSFGRQALSARPGVREPLALIVKLVVLGVAYVALGS